MKNIINIYGAGISGLTVAHILSKYENFDINIYEKDFVSGGMARSSRDKDNVPNEHSWRGYGPFYHNAFNIMKEIPLIIEKFGNDKSNDKPLKKYSITDIQNFPDDKLITFTDKYVYDLTEFINNHPGGEIIKKCNKKNIFDIWEKYGYSWHKDNKNIMKKLKSYKIGILVEKFNNKKTVFDNLNKNRLNFRMLFNEIIPEKYHKYLSFNDYVYLSYLFLKFHTSDKRKEEFFKIPFNKLMKEKLSKYGYHYLADFIAGPGAGFDKNTMSIGHYANFVILNIFNNLKQWQVMNKPTSEAWINPWVNLLEKKGVKIHYNHKLIKINKNGCKIDDAFVKNNNKIIKVKGIHIIAINPNNYLKIFNNTDFKKEHNLFKKFIITNNQISYRLGFNKKINFKKNYNSFVLIDSPYNITFYPQDILFNKDVDLGMNGKIKSLWSGTLILPYNKGILYNKTATSLTKEKLINEIIEQHFKSKELINIIKNKKDFNKKNIIYKNLFEDWKYDENKKRIISINKKWVNTFFNEKYRPIEKTNYKNLFLTGSHCKTTVNVWSMEGAVESGLNCSNLVLEKYNKKVNVINHNKQDKFYYLTKLLQMIDNILYKLDLPNLIDTGLIIVIIVILLKLK